MSRWSSRLANRLAPVRRLGSPADALLFGRIVLFAAAVPLLVRLPLPRLHALIEPRSPARRPEPARVRKIVAYVDDAVRLGWPIVRRGCLTRGLTRYHFLRRAGLDVALCFGAGAPQGEFAGHCWLVLDGEPFLEDRDPRPVIAELYRFGPASRPAPAVPTRG